MDDDDDDGIFLRENKKRISEREGGVGEKREIETLIVRSKSTD